jgi:hypothetical protein
VQAIVSYRQEGFRISCRVWLRREYLVALFFCVLILAAVPLRAATIAVRHVEGVTHGFLVLSNDAGEALAYGDMIQGTKRGVVTSRLTFHFKDGSLYDDTTVFSERGVFRVLSDHLVEKGASFKQPMETWLNANTGTFKAVTTKDGKEELVSKKVKIPADLANGIIYVVIKNIDPKAPSTSVSMLTGTTKPSFVKLVITPQKEENFTIDDLRRTALHYTIKFDLKGVAGVVAPLIGKQPPDIDIWVASDGMPTFLRSRGPLYDGGPIWTITLTTPHW